MAPGGSPDISTVVMMTGGRYHRRHCWPTSLGPWRYLLVRYVGYVGYVDVALVYKTLQVDI